MTLPVMVAVLVEEALKVALPVILEILVVVPVNMIPVVCAPPVRAVESIDTGRIPTVETMGDMEPVSIA